MAQTKEINVNPSSTEERPLSRQELIAQKRKAQAERKKFISLIASSVAVAILFGLPVAFSVNPKTGIMVAAALPTFILCYNYPRIALWAFLAYMPFSGTVTYWVGSGNALFQLSKDAFYIPALLGLIQECRKERKPLMIAQKVAPTLGILVFLTLLTFLIVNGSKQFLLPECSALSSAERFLRDANGELLLDSEGIVISRPCKSGAPFLQGLIGLKVFIGYIPLAFCAYYLIKNKKSLLFLGRFLLVLAIICCSIGLAQYLMLKTGRCQATTGTGDELFKASLEYKCLAGGALLYTPQQGQIRLPGTFVSPWHWAWFLVGNAGICFATAFSDTSFLWRNLGLVGIGLVFVNAVICGQRLALAVVPVFLIILLILTGQFANFKRFIPVAIGLPLVSFFVFSFINPDFIQERIDSFISRWNASPPYLFMFNQFQYAHLNQSGILGNGVGLATNSARVFGPVSLVETYHPKVIMEVGYIGFVAFMVFITHLTFVTFKNYYSLKDQCLRSFAASFWVFNLVIGYFPYWYPLDTDPVAVYFWFFAGVLFKLPVIDKEERDKLRAMEAQNNKGRRKSFKRKKKTVSTA